MHGWGRMRYNIRDGSKTTSKYMIYEGWWRHGRQHGVGRLFYGEHGQVYHGLWRDGQPLWGTQRNYKGDVYLGYF